MPLRRLLKLARALLASWRKLPAEEKQRVHEEAEHVRRLLGELTQHAGARGRALLARTQEPGAPDAQPPRDLEAMKDELLGAVTTLGAAMGPGVLDAARDGTPRSVRLVARLGSGGARRALKRWN